MCSVTLRASMWGRSHSRGSGPRRRRGPSARVGSLSLPEEARSVRRAVSKGLVSGRSAAPGLRGDRRRDGDADRSDCSNADRTADRTAGRHRPHCPNRRSPVRPYSARLHYVRLHYVRLHYVRLHYVRQRSVRLCFVPLRSVARRGPADPRERTHSRPLAVTPRHVPGGVVPAPGGAWPPPPSHPPRPWPGVHGRPPPRRRPHDGGPTRPAGRRSAGSLRLVPVGAPFAGAAATARAQGRRSRRRRR